MGEWLRVVPNGKVTWDVVGPAEVGLVAAAIGAGVFLVQAGEVGGTAFLFLFLGSAGFTVWRSARAGVYLGPRGVLIYNAQKRAYVVPWNEVVRFETRPLPTPDGVGDSDAIYLLSANGSLHETPIRRRRGSKDRGERGWSFAVSLPTAEFGSTVDRLNGAARPFLRGP
ncbi:hypothetical protein ABZ816_25550 [Actinosynnema sp. NPDC047251]|nr:hypothetical protein [Saccharothrix espanaensis]